jgi:hypothetical protein
MAVKAINDTAGPGGLVPTLLVFGAYPRMVDTDSTPSITDRAAAIHKAMEEVRKLRLQDQVQRALHQRNGPDASAIHDLPLNSVTASPSQAIPSLHTLDNLKHHSMVQALL